jgi:hypothetical protein
MKSSEELLIEEIQRKRDLKMKEKMKRQHYYTEKVVKSQQENQDSSEASTALAVGVKKVIAQPAT